VGRRAVQPGDGAAAPVHRDGRHQPCRAEQFLLDGEAYRYRLIQSLNRLHVEQVRYQNDRDQRISADFWRAMPHFAPSAVDHDAIVRRSVAPSFALLTVWLCVLAAALWRTGRRLERNLR
jgi:ABC-2 type transport system permease protein